MTMDSREAVELAQSLRAACSSLSSKKADDIAYGSAESGFDHELWLLLCQQVGITEIALPCADDGDQTDPVALGVAAHELGRALAPVPFLASAVLATGIAADLNCDPGILQTWTSGERTAAAIVTSDGGPWSPSTVSIRATASSGTGDWTLDGTARHVLHGKDADDFVIIAEADGMLSAFLVGRHGRGVVVDSERVLDGTRPMATVTFSRTRAQRLGGEISVEGIVEHNVDRALAVLAAEQVGTCERLLELTTEYAKTRRQFSRPIGSFQAIKHALANTLVDLEWARSAAQAALEELGTNTAEDLTWRASMAKAVCSQALRDAAHTGVQIHGGIGFSWEGPVHRFLRRARTDEVLFGVPAHYWTRLAFEAAHAGNAPAQLAGSIAINHAIFSERGVSGAS